MVDHSFDDAVMAFTRINTVGVPLKKQDIESAQIAARHSGFVADYVVPFLERTRQQGFGRLTVMHLFRACAFVAKPDGRNRTPLHELKKQEVLAAWRKTEKATDQAIGLIRSELGLVNMNILWSGSLIVPLTALCASMPPRKRESRELVGWVALAAFCRRYSGASETALDQDLRAVSFRGPYWSLTCQPTDCKDSLVAQPEDFSGALADRSGLLTLYVACLHRGILDFYMGGKVLLQSGVDRHHIFPRAQFPEWLRSKADNIANMAFIGGDTNKAISSAPPEVYLADIKPSVLESQVHTHGQISLENDKAEAFWEADENYLPSLSMSMSEGHFPNGGSDV